MTGAASHDAPTREDAPLLCAFVLSGAAALGLELIWIRMLALVFGTETFGMLGVLVGFFAGLALGALLLHRPVLRSRRPALVYVAAELIIAVYALVSPQLMLALAPRMPAWVAPLVADDRSLSALLLNLALAALLLLPATVCMGTTTVAVVEAWRRRRGPRDANTVAWLYAANTFGAVLGVAACMYLLLPLLGIQSAAAVLAVCGSGAAALAWRWERARTTSAPAARSATEPTEHAGRLSRPVRSRLHLLLFCTGLAGIALETVGTHVLTQIFDDTVHTFADILAVYLLGTAAGAWLYATTPAAALRDRDRATALLLGAMAATALGAALALSHATALMNVLAPENASYVRRMLAESLIAVCVFVPPTLLMGATYSHLLGHFTREGVGRASACNLLGAALAPLLFGLVLIPAWGYGVAWYGAVAVYLAAFTLAALPRARWRVLAVAVVAGMCVATLLEYSPLVLVRTPPDTRLLAQRVGLQGVVSVSEGQASGVPGSSDTRLLQVDQKYFMGGSPGFVTARMGHLAMLLEPRARDVLFLGVGTGITAGAALDYPVQRVDAVELLPEVLDVLPWFAPHNHALDRDPRVRLHASDARRFVEASTGDYDLIVADLYHPSRDGTGSLYTREHYRNIRNHLREGGAFVQWLPLYQLRPEDLRTIVRTFVEVFPDAHALLGNYSATARLGLVAWKGASAGIDAAAARASLADDARAGRFIDGIADLLAAYMMDAPALRRYAGAGAVNTDLNQRIVFDAARTAGMDNSPAAAASLDSLLPYREAFPDRFIGASDPDGVARLRSESKAYARAVTDYLRAEVRRATAPAGTLPADALDGYFAAYAADVRFVPAVGRLLELSLRDPETAIPLVQRLWQMHPNQPEVDRLHARLAGVTDPARARDIVSRFLASGGD